MVLVLKLQLRPGKVCSVCSVWKLCLGKRGLICGTDPLNPKICLSFVWKQLGNWSVFPFCLPWGRRGSSLSILMQQHRGVQRKLSVRKWVSHWKTRVLSNLWGENTDLYASLSFIPLCGLEVAGSDLDIYLHGASWT